ncbi:MAG: RNA polymerase sigma factor [Gammaproteobacteria bacterium]|jgi:RNA polymerase sigma-70 factor (ECF subfamily)|nr:RNA polymerase sigma factor [Gammaproteobacteria bacterium]
MSLFNKRAVRDAEAFESVVRPHLGPLYRLAYRLAGRREDAEDLVQDLLTKLYARREELDKVEHPRSWLMRVLYRLFIDQRRQRMRSPLHLVPDSQSGDTEMILERLVADDEPAAETERDDQQRALLAALAKLSEDHRRVLALHDIEGYTLEEMQEIIDCPIGTLKSRLHRARARLRELLVEDAARRMEPSASPVRHNVHSA